MALTTKMENVLNVTTAEDIIYTAIAAKNSIIDSVIFANKHATTATTLTIRLRDNSAGTTSDILTAAVLPVGSSITVSDLTLEPLDTIRALAGDANVVDATVFLKELDQ